MFHANTSILPLQAPNIINHKEQTVSRLTGAQQLDKNQDLPRL